MGFRRASGERMAQTPPTAFDNENFSGKNSILPASTFDKSSTSLTRLNRCRELPSTIPICFFCSAFSGPASPWCSSPVNPMIEFNGVRSSCDIVAKNADFSRSAAFARSVSSASSCACRTRLTLSCCVIFSALRRSATDANRIKLVSVTTST